MNTASGCKPVRASDRVNDVLARDEALVEVFVRHSAHFTKLRNRAMRRIMGRLVTVGDASRMAAAPLEILLRDLNDALGIAVAPDPSAVTTAAPSLDATPTTHPAGARVVDVDVRDDLRQGREPLARIMAAVSALREDEVLRVRAIFEPVPLFTLLAQRGFAHESTGHAPDDWSVWFWRENADASPAMRKSERPTSSRPSSSSAANKPVTSAGESETVWLDVRGLQPPEPLMRTLAALETLPAGHQLMHVNSSVPKLLLPMLAERGFACELDESHADQVLLRIWRPAGATFVVARRPGSHHHSPHQEIVMSLQTIELDVRVIPPRDKHPTIFRTFDSLASGQAMVLLNDHDPKPLRYQLMAECPDTFDWTYEAEGPELWRVKISRR